MSLLDVIEALNSATTGNFPSRPQKSFLAARTLAYNGNNETINRLAGEISTIFEEKNEKMKGIQMITEETMIGLMTSSIGIKHKVPLIMMFLNWIQEKTWTNEKTAGIIQSLHIPDVVFENVFVIRTALWNYLTKPVLKKSTFLEILPNGRVYLKPKNPEKFVNNTGAEYLFIANSLKTLVRTNESTPTHFQCMIRYDYTLFASSESTPLKEGQLSKQLRTYACSGYKGYAAANFYMPVKSFKEEEEEEAIVVVEEAERRDSEEEDERMRRMEEWRWKKIDEDELESPSSSSCSSLTSSTTSSSLLETSGILETSSEDVPIDDDVFFLMRPLQMMNSIKIRE